MSNVLVILLQREDKVGFQGVLGIPPKSIPLMDPGRCEHWALRSNFTLVPLPLVKYFQALIPLLCCTELATCFYHITWHSGSWALPKLRAPWRQTPAPEVKECVPCCSPPYLVLKKLINEWRTPPHTVILRFGFVSYFQSAFSLQSCACFHALYSTCVERILGMTLKGTYNILTFSF